MSIQTRIREEARSHAKPREGDTLDRVHTVVLLCVLLLGAALRLYQLTAQKLWLDELYTAELVRNGLSTIWQNAFIDPTLPLPGAIFWLAAQLGGLTPLALRLVSAVAALLVLPLFYQICVYAAGRRVALLATGLLAIAPLAVYYAQEARPYALPLLGQMLALLALERLIRRSGGVEIAWYVLLAVIAAHLHYVNVILIGAQLIVLLAVASDRRTALLVGALTTLALALTFAPFLLGLFNARVAWVARPPLAGPPIQLRSAVETMVAGDPRIASETARQVALAAVMLGCASALIERRSLRALLPHLMQIAFLGVMTFVLLPLAGKPAPLAEERVFLFLLPSVLLCFSVGVRRLADWHVGVLPAVLLCLALCGASLLGVAHYYRDFVKSPEGLIADQIGAHAHSEDVVLNDGMAYSVDAALRFYYPYLPLYSYLGDDVGHWQFVRDTTILPARFKDDRRIALEALPRGDRIWLVTRGDDTPSYYAYLSARYQARDRYQVADFHAQLLEQR